MNDLRLLAHGADNDPAAILLRTARSDKAPKDSKDRVRAMLGIVDAVSAENNLSLPSPMLSLPNQVRQERAKRLRTIAKFVPFQNLISPAKPASSRKFGAVVIAVVQVAAIFAALFVRPLPRIEPVVEASVTRRDEPELLLFVPKTNQRAAATAQVPASKNSPKAFASSKDGFGTAISSHPALPREVVPPRESIVGEEQAGALHQIEERAAAFVVPSVPELSGSSAKFETAPMVFQVGMTKPERIAGAEPIYPMTARLRGVEGTVIMRCVLTEQGLAQNCIILKSPAFLDDAVLLATQSWHFTPVKWQGRAVSVHYVFKVNFKLR